MARRWSFLILRAFYVMAERYDLRATLAVIALVDCPAWYTVYVGAGTPGALGIVLWNGLAVALPRVVLELYWPRAAAAAAAAGSAAGGVGDGAERADVKSEAQAAPQGACHSDGKVKRA